MRIYDRTDFMKLPEGTIYAKGKPWYFEQIHVKAQTLEPNDFVCMALMNFENSGTEQWIERLEEMLQAGASYPMDEDFFGRDGCFNNDDIFMVFEHGDLLTLRKFIDRAIEIVKPSQPLTPIRWQKCSQTVNGRAGD